MLGLAGCLIVPREPDDPLEQRRGLFAYRMKADKITPILLSPNRADLRGDDRDPVALDSGEMFVTGLTSTSGATGADGPTYKIDLRTIVQ